MLGNSSVLGSSISGDATVAVAAPEVGGGGDGGGSGGAGSNSGEKTFRGGEELLGDGERSFGGNRWPRQEALALLQIRSDMDMAFRDASVKGPLWEEVSRKLAVLGYHRSAKKCKEKFENVYKYHRRTKEGRTGKTQGKTYRFFDQLEALENQPPAQGTTHHHQPKPHHQSTMTAAAATIATMAMAPVSNPPTISHLNSSTTVSSSAAPHPIITTVSSQGIATPTLNVTVPNSFPPTNPIVLPQPPQPPHAATTLSDSLHPDTTYHHNTFTSSFPTISTDLMSNSTFSSTSSDEELEGRAKRKRKWKDFFETLTKEVIQKQEDLQKRFVEAIEKREHDRMVREEAWRMQEMARINREGEILAQERSITAAKDAAVMSFLQKVSEQQQNQNQNQNQSQNHSPPPGQSQINNLLQLQPPPLPPPSCQPAPPPPQPQHPATNFDIVPKENNNGEKNNLSTPASTSRWPKVEVQALIKLRTSLDAKYQENGPKGPLWEEISGAMKKLGYNRSAKRCKEKWENINKYFKKVKESNKRRPEDSKTCPYFHLLDHLYRERNKFDQNNVNSITNSSSQFKPKNSVPLMVRPEQQWPPQQQHDNQSEGLMDIDHHHKNQEEDHHEDKEIDGDEDHDEDEEDEGEDENEGDGNYEIVANKLAPVGAAAAQ